MLYPLGNSIFLLCADLINEAFLRQSAFSEVDRYCSPARQAVMMKLIARFIDLSLEAIEHQVDIESITNLPLLRRLRRMNEDLGEDDMEQFNVLWVDMENAFSKLMKQRMSDVS